jgi:hypothetical protein
MSGTSGKVYSFKEIFPALRSSVKVLLTKNIIMFTILSIKEIGGLKRFIFWDKHLDISITIGLYIEKDYPKRN